MAGTPNPKAAVLVSVLAKYADKWERYAETGIDLERSVYRECARDVRALIEEAGRG